MKKTSTAIKKPKTYTLSPNVIGWISKNAKLDKRSDSQFLEMLVLEKMAAKK
jgi:hypothetical protein